MSEQTSIQNELRELNSTLSGQAPRMPYAVPEGYFEGLAGQVMARIRQEEAEQELSTLSPTLSKLSRQTPYSVPDGYFAEPVEVPVQQPARVIPLFRQNWFRFAVASAAVVTGIFVWLGKNEPADAPATAQAVISAYEKDLQQLNEKEQTLLQEFVEAGMTGQETAQIDNSHINTAGLLTDVTEQELTDFLEQSELITETETNE
ncbi:MAG: hypothetical protein ACKO6Q_01980 [Bacteroidota bacterium]